MTLAEVQEEIADEFSLFNNKNDQYNYIIELGKKLPSFPEELRQDERLIKGCQSKVWMASSLQDGHVLYQADSDSTLVKGLVSLLVRVLSGRPPAEIVEAELPFIEQIGLKDMLSMNRSNGLVSMIRQMKLDALAWQAQVQA